MSEQTFEQMLEASFKTIHTGDIVTGTVIDVKADELILNIGYKSDGILPKNEYTNDLSIDLLEAVKPGDEIEVKVLKVNDGEGQVALTHKRIVADRGSKKLEEAFNNQEVLTAKVAQVLDRGICVVVDDVRIFIPASLVSDVFEKDLTKYQDQEISFVMKDYDPKKIAEQAAKITDPSRIAFLIRPAFSSGRRSVTVTFSPKSSERTGSSSSWARY